MDEKLFPPLDEEALAKARATQKRREAYRKRKLDRKKAERVVDLSKAFDNYCKNRHKLI